MSKNWLGMESHPTDDWAFWKTKQEKLESMRKIYDAIIAADPSQAKNIKALIEWARDEAVSDQIYNDADS